MKYFYLCLLVISLGSLTVAQNRNPQNPAVRPRQNNALTPAMKPHKAPGIAPVHHNATGNAGMAPAKNGTDAQLAALERQQVTGHNPKPAPRKNVAVAAGKVNNPAAGANKPMNFNYKAPNVNNTPVGGNANGRGKH